MHFRGAGGVGIALAALSVVLLLLPAGASADFGINSWEASTCTTDTPLCSYASPDSQFFTQVAGHPNFSAFKFGITPGEGIDGFVRDARVDLPPGMSVNPQAAPTCTEAELENDLIGPDGCENKGTRVGTAEITIPTGQTLENLPVFNIAPKPGEPAELGIRFHLLSINIIAYFEGTVAWESDYHEGVTVRQVERTIPPIAVRLALNGKIRGEPFITTGTDCEASTTTAITVDSYADPATRLTSQTTPAGPGRIIQPTGCEAVPFAPSISAQATTKEVDSPSGLAVDLHVPIDSSTPVAQANLKRAVVTLPPGMSLNPAAAQGLEACSDQQFGAGIAIGDRISDPAGVHPPPLACPPGSEVGTVSVETPVLPAPVTGKLYLGRQLSRDPASGKEYRVFLDAEAPQLGVYVRLSGEIAADPASGRLTATFDDPAQGGLPQVPFSHIKLAFDDARGLLTTPPTCGEQKLSGVLSPWSGAPAATAGTSFALSAAPSGAPCPAEPAKRPFAPAFSVGLANPKAGAFGPLRIGLTRADGEQELKGLDITLPPGESAKLAGVPYCPEDRIAAAAARGGAEEAAAPSCPPESQVGRAEVAAGSGPTPLGLTGKAYLAGPYQGAKLSLVVVVPALAGPFDLGTVVVRSPLSLDPETAQIHLSAALPHLFGGVKLDIRSVKVEVDRPGFALAGTNCRAAAAAATLRGGGGDPADPAQLSTATASAPLGLGGCAGLRFAPAISLRLSGARRRAHHPSLAVRLKTKAGDANIARASVALPHALFLDQASLGRICSKAQFAANQCPPESVYGFARAYSPLLDTPLEGPVYLRSSAHALPDLIAHLQGQVDIDLTGRIDSFKGGIRTTFERVPDVPVSKFTLSLPGGKHGLLVASTNLCGAPVRAVVALQGQNGHKVNGRPKVRVGCGKRRKRAGR
jgi:hypothetical protein